MGESRYWQTVEGLPENIPDYLKRAHSQPAFEAGREAVEEELERGVDEFGLREKIAELLRGQAEDQRQVEAAERRSRIIRCLHKMAREIRELPKEERDSLLLGAFIQTFGPAIDHYLTERQQHDRRRRGHRRMDFYKKAIRDFRALEPVGVTKDHAHAIARGVGIRAGKTPTS